MALVAAMRPRQWTKNLALFVGIVFAQRLLDLSAFERAFVAFVVFCLASSSIYILKMTGNILLNANVHLLPAAYQPRGRS